MKLEGKKQSESYSSFALCFSAPRSTEHTLLCLSFDHQGATTCYQSPPNKLEAVVHLSHQQQIVATYYKMQTGHALCRNQIRTLLIFPLSEAGYVRMAVKTCRVVCLVVVYVGVWWLAAWWWRGRCVCQCIGRI